MLWEFGLNLDSKSGPVLGCHFVLGFFFFLLFPCVFLSLQLVDVGALLVQTTETMRN